METKKRGRPTRGKVTISSRINYEILKNIQDYSEDTDITVSGIVERSLVKWLDDYTGGAIAKGDRSIATTKMFSDKIPPSLLQRVQDFSEQTSIPISIVLEQSLKDFLEKKHSNDRV